MQPQQSTDIDAYLEALPEPQRSTIKQMRERIRAAAPDAVESFGYGMPGFKYRGRSLLYVAAWKQHCGLYGANIEAHRADLERYDLDKGTIRFATDKPLPKTLVTKLVRTRIAEIDAAEAARKSAHTSRAR